jgi:four helix bundle protein
MNSFKPENRPRWVGANDLYRKTKAVKRQIADGRAIVAYTLFVPHYRRVCAVKTFRDLKFWDRMHHLVVRVYEVTRSYPKEELINLTATMRRTATTMASAVVEGSALGGEREQLQLLQTAVGATGQLEYQLLLSQDLGYIDATTFDELSTELLDLRRQLTTHFIKVKAIR